MQYTTDLKSDYFHLAEDCVSFIVYYSPLYQPHRELFSQEQCNCLLQLDIYF